MCCLLTLVGVWVCSFFVLGLFGFACRGGAYISYLCCLFVFPWMLVFVVLWGGLFAT